MPLREDVLHAIDAELARLEDPRLSGAERLARTCEVVERCVARIHDFARAPNQEAIVPVERAVTDALARITSRTAADAQRISTGFPPIDRVLDGGLPIGGVSAIGAFPGVGRTSLALAIGHAVAERAVDPATPARERHGVLVVSPELRPAGLVVRLVSMTARLPWSAIASDTADVHGWPARADAIARLPLWVADLRAPTPADVAAAVRARDLERDALGAPPIKLVIVDRVQLLSPRPDVAAGRDPLAIWHGLRELARDLGVAVLATTDLRSTVRRAPHRPGVSDLPRGCLDHADVAMLLHRPEHTLRMRGYEVPARVKGRADVRVVAHRHGRAGTATLLFREAYGRFERGIAIDDDA